MKHLYIILLLGLFSHSYAQTIYFNKAIEDDTISLISASTLAIQDGYFLLGNFNSYNSYSANILLKLDFKGELVWTKILEETLNASTVQTGSTLIRVQNNYNHFILTYAKYKDDTYEDLDIVVLKFNLEGEIIWRKVYGDENWQGALSIINTKDNGFLIAGFQQPKGGGYQRFYYFKIDSDGNQEWLSTHSRDSGGGDMPVTIFQTQDEGYILSGTGYSNNTDYDMYIIKTKPNGIIEWTKSYGTDEVDGMARIVQLFPEGYFMSGGIKENGVRKSYFAKLDDLGNVIWERVHHFDFENIHHTYSFETNPLLTLEGGFIGVMPYMTNDFIVENLLVKLDSRGDIVWTKRLTPDPNNDVYVKDIEMTSDGYIISGFNYTHQPQYGWIVKTDFEGNTCWELGCDSMTIATDIPVIGGKNPYQVEINPNPVKDLATVSYQLPMDALLQLFDLRGALVKRFFLPAAFERLPLEVGELEGGLYLYKVSIGGREVSGGKLLIER